jgi:hypothetical protein
VDFPTITNLMKKNLFMEIAPAGGQGDPLVDLGYTSRSEYSDGSMLINNVAQEGDLIFKYGCKVGLEKLLH